MWDEECGKAYQLLSNHLAHKGAEGIVFPWHRKALHSLQ